MAEPDREVIRRYDDPRKEAAGYVVLSGNLFDSAVMKITVIDREFRRRFLSDPAHPNVLEGKAIVFEGPEDYQLSGQRRGGEHAGWPRASWRPAAPSGRRPSSTTRRRGRRFIAAWRASLVPAAAWSRRRSIST